MNWDTCEGIWRQGMKARVLRMVALAATFVVSLFLPIAVIGYGAQITGSVIWFPIFFATILLGSMGVWAVFRAKRDNVLARIVPENKGRVCPKCAVVLLQRDDSPSLRCGRCGRSYEEPDLNDHWWRYGISPVELLRWLPGKSRELIIENNSIQMDLALQRTRRQVYWFVPVMIALAVLPMTVVSLNMGWPVTMQYVVPVALLWAGFGVAMGFGWRVVDPARLVCAVCRYECEAAGGEQCPECGAPWRERGGTIAGQVGPRRGVLILAGLILTISLAGFVNIMTGLNVVTRATPTATVINRIVESSDPDNMMHWQDLAGRQLTLEQERLLIEALLAKRNRGELAMLDAPWLGRSYQAGMMPEDLVQEFFKGMMEVQLSAPETAAMGDTVEISINKVDRFSATLAQFPTVIIGGLSIGDDPTPHLRSSISIPGLFLGSDPSRSAHSFVAERPGKLRIRLELWVLAVPTANDVAFIVDWNDDDTPVLPEQYEWVEHVVIERIIEVVEN